MDEQTLKVEPVPPSEPKVEEKAANASGETTPKKHPNLVAPWKPGTSGNPKGRRPGSRNRVSEAVTSLFEEAIEADGGQSLALLKQKEPATFWRIAASFVPSKVEQEVHKTISIFDSYDLQDRADFHAAWKLAKSVLGIEQQPPIDVTPQPEPVPDE
jgi:hypothetical protein